MAKGIIFYRHYQITPALEQSSLNECYFINIDTVVMPSPYTGYFWDGNEKVIISDYDYVVIFSVDKIAKEIYIYLHNHIKIFGNPFVRNQFTNKVLCQIIAAVWTRD